MNFTSQKFQHGSKIYIVQGVDASTLHSKNKGTRYVIMDESGRVINDAQGYGFKSEGAAIRAFQFVGSEAYMQEMEKRYGEPITTEKQPKN